MYSGKFISFEGGEGSGKSSMIVEIYNRLLEKGYKVVVTREPGGVKISEQIRNVILDKENNMCKETEALLYAASRTEHLFTHVVPLLETGYIVLSDRYIDSSLAYQGYARGIGIDNVLNINRFACEYMPDKTFFIDVRPEVGLARIKGREKIDRLDLETIDFHERVYQGYLECCKLYPNRIQTINGERPYDEVLEDVYNEVLKLL